MSTLFYELLKLTYVELLKVYLLDTFTNGETQKCNAAEWPTPQFSDHINTLMFLVWL